MHDMGTKDADVRDLLLATTHKTDPTKDDLSLTFVSSLWLPFLGITIARRPNNKNKLAWLRMCLLKSGWSHLHQLLNNNVVTS